MGVTNTHRPTLEHLQRLFGGTIGSSPPANSRTRHAWKWRVHGKTAAHVIACVLPFLREKAPQAQLILDYRGLKPSDPRRAVIKEAISSLKRPEFRCLKST